MPSPRNIVARWDAPAAPGVPVAPKSLGQLSHYAFDLAVDQLFVYVAVPDGNGGVFRMRKDAAETTATRMGNKVTDVWNTAVDDEAVYESDPGTAMIRRLIK